MEYPDRCQGRCPGEFKESWSVQYWQRDRATPCGWTHTLPNALLSRRKGDKHEEVQQKQTPQKLSRRRHLDIVL